jgi:hypothetical protein
VDATAHYRNLIALGREEFLASSAAAVLVRYRAGGADHPEGASTLTLDQDIAETIEETVPFTKDFGIKEAASVEVYPLTKKPGASFPDRITIGRTPNNDIVVVDHSVSRFHAYVRKDGAGWVVADAGSKNGSWLASSALEPRKERKVPSRTVLRFGDVDLTFLLAQDLYGALGGA